jgi:hypothetical protein
MLAWPDSIFKEKSMLRSPLRVILLLALLAATALSCRSKGPVDPGPAPAAPSGLTVVLREPTRMTLRWVAGDSLQSGFHIYARPDTGTNWTVRANVTADVRLETVSNLAASTKYRFRVTAYNAGGESSQSNEVLDSTLATSVPIVGSWIASSASLLILNLQSSQYLLASDFGYQWNYRTSTGAQGLQTGHYSIQGDTLYFARTGIPDSTYGYFYQLISNNNVLKLRYPISGSTPDLIYNRRQ